MEYIALVTRRESPLWVSLVCEGGGRARFEKALGWDFAISDYKYSSRSHLISQRDVDALFTLIRDQAITGDFYSWYLDQCRIAARALERVTDRGVESVDVRKEALARAYREFSDAVLRLMPFLASFVLVQDQLEFDLRAALATELNAEADSEEVQRILSEGVVASEQAAIVNETRHILSIATDIERQDAADATSFEQLPPGVQSKIEAHVAQFGWLYTFAYLRQPASLTDIADRALRSARRGESAARVVDALDRTRAAETRAKEISDRLPARSEARCLLALSREYLYWRIARVDVQFRSEVRFRPVLSQIANLASLPSDLLCMATHSDITTFLEGRSSLPNVDELRMRRKYGVDFRVSGGKITHRTCAAPARDEAMTNTQPSGELIGLTACCGHGRGRVAFVESGDEAIEVEEAVVLVTSMTTPDLISAIERAVAIVTDEGGLLCHAAIISRELNIPCVIGTKSATQRIDPLSFACVDAGMPAGTVSWMPCKQAEKQSHD